MKKLIDYLYRFDRRLVSPIYDVEKDFGFGCMDKVAIAEDLGFTSEESGVVRIVTPHPFQSVEEVERFPWRISLEGEHTRNELAAVQSWCAQSTVLQGGGSFGPLTVAACILGVENCCRMVRKNSAVVHAVLRRLTDFMILLAREEERLGADCYWVAEPVASLLSPAACRRFCTPYLKELFDALDIPGALHVCGNTDPHTRALLETGAQLISIDFCTDLPSYLDQAPSDVVIMGNINPMLLWKGSLDDVRRETETLLRQTRHYKNFLMSSGCMVPYTAPRENVQLMVDITKSWPTWSNDEFRLITRLWELYGSEGEEAFARVCREERVPEPIVSAAAEVARRRLPYQSAPAAR